MAICQKVIRDMIAVRKRPEGLEDYEEIRVNNFKATMINDVLSLATGLDMAIHAIKPGEITKKAKKGLSEVVASSYRLFAHRIAHNILQEEELIKEEAVTDLLYRFDLPDDTHDDLIIYFKKL